MNNIKLYGILRKGEEVVSNVFMASDDVQAGAFMVKNLLAISKDVPEKLRGSFLDDVHITCLVKLGEVDVLKHQLITDYNNICDFSDFNPFSEEVNKNEDRAN